MGLIDWVNQNCKFAAKPEAEPTKAPAPWGVLYAGPNPDGSRKKCDNCFMFLHDKKRCVIHDKDLYVSDEHVCGYHVYGKPLANWMQQFYDHISPVDPNTSGLVRTVDGSSCDICARYKSGWCFAVAERDDSDPPVRVEPLGCCARWVGK
jgi:hypothetical protein